MSILLDPPSCVPLSYLLGPKKKQNLFFVTGPWAAFLSASVTCRDLHAGPTFLVNQNHQIPLAHRNTLTCPVRTLGSGQIRELARVYLAGTRCPTFVPLRPRLSIAQARVALGSQQLVCENRELFL